MTTIVNNPGPERVVETDGSSGWAVSVIILLAVIAIGGYYWVNHRAATPAASGTNINVTIPTSNTSPGTPSTTY
jgi:hypothetical protein